MSVIRSMFDRGALSLARAGALGYVAAALRTGTTSPMRMTVSNGGGRTAGVARRWRVEGERGRGDGGMGGQHVQPPAAAPPYGAPVP